MNELSLAVEFWLSSLEEEFSLEILNQSTDAHAKHCRFPSAAEAKIAMLRRAYLKGYADAVPATFEEDVERVSGVNATQRK